MGASAVAAAPFPTYPGVVPGLFLQAFFLVTGVGISPAQVFGPGFDVPFPVSSGTAISLNLLLPLALVVNTPAPCSS